MATLQQMYQMRADADLRNKVAAAIGNLAYYIISTEAANVANHANRLIWARQALQDSDAMAGKMLWAVIANVDIQTGQLAGNTADSLITYVVGVITDTFATGS